MAHDVVQEWIYASGEKVGDARYVCECDVHTHE